MSARFVATTSVNASARGVLPLTGGTLTGTLTFADGSTWTIAGLAMANGRGISTSGAGVLGAGFGLDQNAVGDIVSRNTGRLGFVSGTAITNAPDAYFTRTATGVLKANNYIGTVPTTVASLPAAATAGAGARGYVTDANSTTFNAAAAGGGTNSVPVHCTGAAWQIG